MKKFAIALCFIRLFSINEHQVYACDCANLPATAWEELQQSDSVFVGRVIGVRRVQIPAGMGYIEELEIRLKVKQILKGSIGKEVILRTGVGGGDCGLRLNEGGTYLVYAHATNAGQMRMNICTRTKLLKNAGQDLKEIKAKAVFELQTSREIQKAIP